MQLVESEGTLEEVEEMAKGAAEEARRELSIFPDVAARQALEFAPLFVLRRRS
ncbi:MAG: hypothetical protein IH969_04490, partial [Candidatus Krumholzibacteriota bacterium]|nr:hypothetical protein [Candidatus Krumholzibacteriota bacterium]